MSSNYINITMNWTAYHCWLSKCKYKEKDSRVNSVKRYNDRNYYKGKYSDRDVFILLHDRDRQCNEFAFHRPWRRIPTPLASINNFLHRNTTKPRFITGNNVKFDNNPWEALTLKEREIIIVESGTRSASTIGEMTYSERFNSFFKNGNPDSGDIVHPSFLNLKGFDPKIMADYGLRSHPPWCEYDEAVKHYNLIKNWSIYPPERIFPNMVEELSVKDAITSNDGYTLLSLSKLKCDASFPDNMILKDGTNKTTEIETIKITKELPIFTKYDQPRNASVVKLAGIDAYLITPEDNKRVFKFETMSESEFNKVLVDSWPNYVEKETSSDCFECSFHSLQRVLPKTNSNLVMMNKFIETLKRLTEETKENKKLKENAETLRKPITKFQSLYQELLLIQHQKMFYDCRKGATEKKYGHLIKDKCEIESAVNKLKEIESGIIEKLNMQSLAFFLTEFSVLLIGQLHLGGRTVSSEIKSSLLAMSVEICGLIHSYKEKADEVYSRGLDALNLIAPYHTSKLVNNDSVSGKLRSCVSLEDFAGITK